MTRERKPDKLLAFTDVVLEHESAKAYKIDFGDAEPLWIPKSHVKPSVKTEDGEVKTDLDNGTIVMTEWIAQQKGLA
jgi:hypothetical protein